MLQQSCRQMGLWATAFCRQSLPSGNCFLTTSSAVGPAEAAREQRAQEGDSDYNATPQYPNKTPEDGSAADAAMASSRAPHPSGPMDSSSVNDPAGRADNNSPQRGQQRPDSASADSHAMHVHHPGREADVAGLGLHGSNSSSSGGVGGSNATGGGGGDVDPATDTTNSVSGSERAMTADFAAGGDDVSPAVQGSAPVNPDTGMPAMAEAGDAGADSGRFGQLKEPQDVGEEGLTARQTERSTGMDPGTSAD